MTNGKIIPHKDFRGFKWAPSYEQEVVLLFGMLLPYLDNPILIDKCQDQFPDCMAFNPNDGSEIRIEFELQSGNFQQHKHDPTKCDMIVCWIHNWPDFPKSIKIIELSRIIKEKKLEFILDPGETKYPKTVWDEKSFFEAAGPNPPGYIHEVYHFCQEQKNLIIGFGKGEKTLHSQFFMLLQMG